MADFAHNFASAPAAVWNALPAGVHAVNGQGPHYDGQRGFVATRTGFSWRSYGQEITARVEPGPGYTTLRMHTSLKFGAFDWGEGKRICLRFTTAVAQALGEAPPA